MLAGPWEETLDKRACRKRRAGYPGVSVGSLKIPLGSDIEAG